MKYRILLISLICIGVFTSVIAKLGRLEGGRFTRSGRLSQTESRFGFSNWRGVVRSEYSGVLTEWDIPPLNIATSDLSVCVGTWHDEYSKEMTIRPQHKGMPYLKVMTRVCDDVDSAHDAIINFFNSVTSTRDYSSCTNDFGDRSYTIGSSAVFARNNIFVRVHSGTNTISAEAVARQIDADILQRSTMANP